MIDFLFFVVAVATWLWIMRGWWGTYTWLCQRRRAAAALLDPQPLPPPATTLVQVEHPVSVGQPAFVRLRLRGPYGGVGLFRADADNGTAEHVGYFVTAGNDTALIEWVCHAEACGLKQ